MDKMDAQRNIEVRMCNHCCGITYSKSEFLALGIQHVMSYVACLAPPYFSILSYSMVQSPSWETHWFAASQETPRISRNPKVHYRTHKRPPPVSILGQPNPVHIPTSHLLEIRPNIIHPSTPRSPQWSPSLPFPHQDYIHPSPHPHAPHAQPISLFSILSPAQYCSILSHKLQDFRKHLLVMKCVFRFSLQILSKTSQSKINSARYHKCACKVPFILVRFQWKIFSKDRRKFSNIKFNKKNPSCGIRIVPRGRTDGKADMKNLLVAFRNFVHAPEKEWYVSYMYACKCVCIYTYFYTYIHTCIYIYIHTHTHTHT